MSFSFPVLRPAWPADISNGPAAGEWKLPVLGADGGARQRLAPLIYLS
ncbi:hypothetical protein [Peterkaempfera griseoplana]|nr:hypothetical protein [Peterkaempfera griseoplana]